MEKQAGSEFGRLLRQQRLSAGLTQEALASLSGLSVRGISDLERGQRRTPRLDTIRMLSGALGSSDDQWAKLIRASRPHLELPATESGVHIPASFNRRPLNLPHSLTSLVGRTHDIARITAKIRQTETRLLTLTGPGGIGKTRLALELVEQLTDAFTDGAHFVPLVPLNSADLVIPAIAKALDVHEADNQSLPDTLSAHLRESDMLLLLDNFEHVLDAASDVQELLARCPTLKIVTTSRAPLHVRMEHIMPIDPLALPEIGSATSLADLERFDALALFVDRARMADASFSPTSEHVAAIVAICHKLDGLPLAIELAAARVRVVSVGELQSILDDTLPVLTGGPRDLPERHHTLYNTINWSYTLLTESDRTTFRNLAVFAGGWTLDAAQAVIHGDKRNTITTDVLNSADTLITHSLVRRLDTDSGPTRFGMLQTIREFGSAQLAIHGEEADIRRRHARYFLAYVEGMGFDIPTTDEAAGLNLVAREHDNLRVALRWLITAQDAPGALALCSAMSRFWTVRGFLSEARAQVNEALAIPDPAPGPARAKALYTGCLLACHQHDLDQAGQFALESLALSQKLENEHCTVTALLGIGLVAQLKEEYQDASRAYEEGITLARILSHPKLSTITGNLAQVQFHLEHVERAIDLLNECIAFDRASGNIPYTGVHLTDLGLVLLECGDIQPAQDAFSEALRIHRKSGNMRMSINTIEGLAGVAANRGDATRAAMLFGAGEELRRSSAYPQPDPAQWSYHTNRTLALRALGIEAFEQALAAGRMMAPGDAIELALTPLSILAPDRPDRTVNCDTPAL